MCLFLKFMLHAHDRVDYCQAKGKHQLRVDSFASCISTNTCCSVPLVPYCDPQQLSMTRSSLWMLAFRPSTYIIGLDAPSEHLRRERDMVDRSTSSSTQYLTV